MAALRFASTQSGLPQSAQLSSFGFFPQPKPNWVWVYRTCSTRSRR